MYGAVPGLFLMVESSISALRKTMHMRLSKYPESFGTASKAFDAIIDRSKLQVQCNRFSFSTIRRKLALMAVKNGCQLLVPVAFCANEAVALCREIIGQCLHISMMGTIVLHDRSIRGKAGDFPCSHAHV